MSQPELVDHQPAHVPTHHVAFLVAAVVTAAVLVLQFTYGTRGHPVAKQALVTLLVGAVITWCWFLAAHVVHCVCRRLDHIEERMAALEGDGLDDESELALRRINRRLSGGAR